MGKMEKQHCVSCAKTTWHNPTGKKDGSPRCTYCGYPVSTNPSKRDHFDAIRRQQVNKAQK